MTTDETNAIKSEFLLQQYGKLREEIYHRTYVQQQLVTIAVLGAGAVLTVGSQANATLGIPALLLYPLLAMFLALAWSTQYANIRTMGAFIARQEREIFLGDDAGAYGWETLLQHSSFGGKSGRALFSGWLDAKGIFVGLQSLAIALAVARSGISVHAIAEFFGDPGVMRPYLWSITLGGLDLIAVAVTLSLPGSHPAMRRFSEGMRSSRAAMLARESGNARLGEGGRDTGA
jgi:hypothetical protein